MIALFAVASALATAQPGLAGTWRSADQSSVARIAPCPGKSGRLCANVIGEVGASGAGAAGRLVLTDLEPSGPGKWKGRYLLGSEALPATLKLQGNMVEMKVCRFVFCQSDSYRRVLEVR